MPSSISPITLHERIESSPAAVFSAFVDDFAKWYHKEYTWSQNGLETITIEPKGGAVLNAAPMGLNSIGDV